MTIYNYEELHNIDPTDTIHRIILYYSKEHVDIVLHTNYCTNELDACTRPGYMMIFILDMLRYLIQ